jgi:hypothetical protein
LKKIIFYSDKITRGIVRRVVKHPARWLFYQKFKRAFEPHYKAFWVVDIDNTVAATAEKLTPQYNATFPHNTAYERLMAIEAWDGMRQLLAKKPADVRLIFFSARSYDVYWTTKKWLKTNGFWQKDAKLVLVDRMVLKPIFFKKLLGDIQNTPPQYDITFFDDLSYNKEHGELKFFEDALAETQKLPIKYVGYAELMSINNISG